jgi:hypothetical protein
MMQTTEVEQAIKRLWQTIPIGSGRDFNLVLKELERRGQLLDTDPIV